MPGASPSRDSQRRDISGPPSTISTRRPCASFPAGEAEILDIRSGCDILDSKDPYDLIFLDPYDDIWVVCETVLAKSVAQLRHASILIFFPFKTEAQRDFLTTAVGRLGINCQLGFVMNPGSSQDGRCHFATVFMPGLP